MNTMKRIWLETEAYLRGMKFVFFTRKNGKVVMFIAQYPKKQELN